MKRVPGIIQSHNVDDGQVIYSRVTSNEPLLVRFHVSVSGWHGTEVFKVSTAHGRSSKYFKQGAVEITFLNL